MPISRSPTSDTEIITPSMQLRLKALETKHEVEEAQLARLESLANLMDAQFNIPFLPIPIGLDTIVGLIPGIGDTISLGVSGFIVAGAVQAKLSMATPAELDAAVTAAAEAQLNRCKLWRFTL